MNRPPKFEKLAVIFAGAGLLTAALVSLDFSLLEANLYDLRMSAGPQPRANPEIVLVSVDNHTTEALQEITPLSLNLHTRLLEILEKAEPRALGYLVDFNRVIENDPEQIRSEWTERFMDSAKRMESRGVPVIIGTLFDVKGEVLPPYPLSSLSHAIALIHKDGNVFAEDRITRRALTYLYNKPVFHMELARSLGAVTSGHSPRGTFNDPEAQASYFFFRYHGSPAGRQYTQVSMSDVLNGSVPPQAFQNKIVLIGTQIREDANDFILSPYSKNPFLNPKLVLHAHILDSIMNDDGIVRAPVLLNIAVTFAMTAFVLWWVMVSTPLYGMMTVIGLAVMFYIVSHLFFLKGLWIRASQPLVGTFLGFYLAVPYRLILEYRKRWNYQRKNEVLIQVEELKTNFVSLVTHDLKTPVARIQGLAEVLRSKADARLVERDKETLAAIMASTEELNRFISSILELNKVESNRLQISLECRDINQLIERAIEGFKAQARARQVRILPNLEPLFPIRIDTTLISKVINNLIDNALKYSPAGSEIKVESQELNEHVVISVTDHGIGMTQDEIDNLFTKFYRAKNDTTTQIAGTGLGLYLTKYFVEAHQGYVRVQSKIGIGSTFSIFLPIKNSSISTVATPTGLTRLTWLNSVQRLFRKKEKSDV